MKKIQIIMCLLILSPVWAQKENSRNENNPTMLSDEKINGAYTEIIDAKLIQQIRMIKQNKEKAFMKKQILSGQKVVKKTFKVSSSESKYFAIREIINELRNTKQIKLEPHMNSYKKYKDKNSEKIINNNINNNSR